jgi:UDP-glucose 6-dehydrogenase
MRMTLAGTGVVGIVTPVHKLVKHLYHLACGNIDDSHVLALTRLQKI